MREGVLEYSNPGVHRSVRLTVADALGCSMRDEQRLQTGRLAGGPVKRDAEARHWQHSDAAHKIVHSTFFIFTACHQLCTSSVRSRKHGVANSLDKRFSGVVDAFRNVMLTYSRI